MQASPQPPPERRRRQTACRTGALRRVWRTAETKPSSSHPAALDSRLRGKHGVVIPGESASGGRDPESRSAAGGLTLPPSDEHGHLRETPVLPPPHAGGFPPSRDTRGRHSGRVRLGRTRPGIKIRRRRGPTLPPSDEHGRPRETPRSPDPRRWISRVRGNSPQLHAWTGSRRHDETLGVTLVVALGRRKTCLYESNGGSRQ